MIIHHRNGFGQWLTDHGYIGEGVEVGVQEGENAERILQSWKGTLWLVDPWKKQDPKIYTDRTNEIDFEAAYKKVMDRMKPFEGRYRVLRMLSAEAAGGFKDESLTFVYLDGNHRYEFIREDLKLWYPKIRHGGILCGHDFANENKEKVWLCGVKRAVEQFSDEIKKEIHASDGGCTSWWIHKI